MGGLAAVAVSLSSWPLGILSVLVAVLAGVTAGGLFALLPGVLKAKFNVNEIVTTILFNYVALLFVDYVAGGPLHQAGSSNPQTPTIPSTSFLPTTAGSALNPSILIAVVASGLVLFLITRTKLGFELRMMGGNRRAARYVGVNTVRNTMIAMFLSGALAGLAGSLLLVGGPHAWFAGVSKSYGYLGIGVALVAGLNPIVAIISAIFFSTLNQGGIVMQSVTGVPYEMAQVIAAIVVIVILLHPTLEGKLRSYGL